MPQGEHTFPDGFEWDEAKRRANVAKHGIDFVDAGRVFKGNHHEWRDDRRSYGEGRIRVIGEVDGEVLFVVYTWRESRRRLITARRANANERKAHYTRFP